MKRYMFCGYPKGEVRIKQGEQVVTASVAYYKNMAFLYFESVEEVLPEQVAEGQMIPFPDGSNWWRMTEVFHTFPCDNDELWKRREKNKQADFRVNYLHYDKIASYIYYHFDHQEGNQVGCDRYMSIFSYQNLLMMYLEEPVEKVTWSDIEGKRHVPCLKNWGPLMDEHIRRWEDGSTEWRQCRR